jgi:hypothetical protein
VQAVSNSWFAIGPAIVFAAAHTEPARAGAALLAAALLAAAAGCGGGGGGGTTTSVAEREADAAILSTAIARELSTAQAYRRGAALPGRAGSKLFARFRAQALEHVDALTKAVRGLGQSVAEEPVQPEKEELKTRAEFLAFAYELESAAVAETLRASAELSSHWPRTLLVTIATNQAQHLVLLRQALGAAPVESVPEPFESGTTPPPAQPPR